MKCKEVCPTGAIIEGPEERIDRSKCTRCMKCVEVCSHLALKRIGTCMTVKELVNILLKYKPFYGDSDRGGVTVSGGDPVFQPEFTIELLKECRKKGCILQLRQVVI